MTDEQTHDVIVLGAGSTGTNVAWYARDHGLDVAIVESELVGGECSYWACIPSKALLAAPNAVAAVRRLPGADVDATVDVARVLARRDELIGHLDDTGSVDWVESIGADLIRGHGRIVGEREVEVTAADGGTRRLRAERAVVVATGSRAARPPVEGVDDITTWDSRDVTTADTIPKSLIVVGGGVVGCEMAQAHRRLGAAEVMILERSERILMGSEPWVSRMLAEAFDDDGIHVRTDRSVTRVSRSGGSGPVTVELDNGTSVTGDELLFATGRKSNTDDIGLDAIGLEPGGPLEVDDQLRVPGIEWLYAAGDVNGRALLTHQGKYQGRIVGDAIAGDQRSAWADHRAVPQVMFTDPEVATVGPTPEEARADGREVKVVSVELSAVAGSKFTGGKGRAQLVIDEDRRNVIGATFVGPQVGELLHAATVAIVGQVPIATLWHAVPAFPTVSEVWLRLLEADRSLIQ